MIAIINYGAGNLCSVTNALTRLNVEFCVTDNKDIISKADKVILPGVGEASSAMKELEKRDLIDCIKSLKQPLLGICLGMQLLCRHSQEGDCECINVIPTDVVKMDKDDNNKVPHIGWNNIQNLKSELFNGVEDSVFMYYVHSYAAPLSQYTICTTTHSEQFSGALKNNNFYGCQFHPEKSGDIGEMILKNFLAL